MKDTKNTKKPTKKVSTKKVSTNKKSKKDYSILYLIIGVSVLTGAVIGASFAYFSVSVSGGSSNTTAKLDLTDAEIGDILLSGGGANLSLELTEDNFNDTIKEDTKIYAKDALNKDNVSIGHFTKSGAADNRTYTCTFTLTGSATGIQNILSTDEAYYVLTGGNNITLKKLETDDYSSSITGEWSELSGDGFSYFGKWETTNTVNDESDVFAKAYVTNKYDRIQNHLAVLDATLQFNVSGIKCTSVKND